MWGTFINVAAVLGGSVVGLLVGKRLPSRVSDAVMPTMGLFTLFLGIKTAFETENSMIVLFSLVIGTVIGSLIDIERHLDRLGEFLKRRVGSNGSGDFTQGFVTACILYCVGPMAIMGAIQDGLLKDSSILITKSVMDGVSSIAYSSSLGVGVAFSAIPLLIYQGLMSLLATWVSPLMSASVIAEMSATGGVLLMAIVLNLTLKSKIKVGNMLPSLFVAIAIAAFMT